VVSAMCRRGVPGGSTHPRADGRLAVLPMRAASSRCGMEMVGRHPVEDHGRADRAVWSGFAGADK
jgi:hypothetical protein